MPHLGGIPALARKGGNRCLSELFGLFLERPSFIRVRDLLERGFERRLYLNPDNRTVNLYVDLD